MEERNILKTIEDIDKLFKEVRSYILNTEHYIFYWIANREIKDYIEEYPDDFEDNIKLTVDELNGGNSVTVEIEFEYDHPHNVERIQRFCHLDTFRDEVKFRFAEYKGSIAELRLKEAERDLEHYKKYIAEEEEKIAELKRIIAEEKSKKTE